MPVAWLFIHIAMLSQLKGLDSSTEAPFMSEDYLKMMWRRIEFLNTVLQMGYSFVFTDADIMWLRNPFPRFYPQGRFSDSLFWFMSRKTYPARILTKSAPCMQIAAMVWGLKFMILKLCLKIGKTTRRCLQMKELQHRPSWRAPQNCRT
ncbi:hypothetical protein OIU77_008296 [Salix suchowensis]|uniref:Nucleotide-diphospho-sugar transferase domain-containing protein n=1 Tax=Salix suchowensis TaxID=1278906 RepID=A0ABQ9AKA9_9ROSI|nr:hypothetical protein OIU77_008296 [Salix suchowensis]